jgi:hypothetical protein
MEEKSDCRGTSQADLVSLIRGATLNFPRIRTIDLAGCIATIDMRHGPRSDLMWVSPPRSSTTKV